MADVLLGGSINAATASARPPTQAAPFRWLPIRSPGTGANVTEFAAKWDAAATSLTTMTIGLERTDVDVTHLTLAWVPVE